MFKRNGDEYFRLDDLTGTDILNVADGKGMSSPFVFGNTFSNRTLDVDTIFEGSNVAGTARVEYMRWNHTDQSFDFNSPIDNTSIAIIGNLIDTTVSDERLKNKIEDVECDFSDCVKNVKVKTFEYNDVKYKNNDTFGMIAQELQKHLPKECKNIVSENKVKNEDETYLSINCMKLSVVLWGALQETLNKVEHLESSVYELQEAMKEMKGKGKGEAKAKPKPKPKVKSKD